MIDDDGYDGIRSHGVDPDWNPFSTPRDDDPDDIGWDDGSETPHANPSRMSRKGVAVLTACTLVIAVAGIGMVITESRLSVRHDQLVSECSDAVASMNRNRERLEGLVAVDLNIDGSVLDGKKGRTIRIVTDHTTRAIHPMRRDSEEQATRIEHGEGEETGVRIRGTVQTGGRVPEGVRQDPIREVTA